MSKINQIQSSLSEIDATKFHKLIDVYLNKKYKYNIHSTGTKIGEDKPRKGTPDTLITLNNGQYIFAEYTTQKSNIINKFKEDISKCLDESKTNIKTTQIEKIILACNSNLQSNDIETLRKSCLPISCEIITNSSLSNDLNSNFPNISRDFLNIEVDTGQILDSDDFVKAYDASKYTTPLDIPFLEREEEITTLLTSIEKYHITVISGKAGAGKTKLALEASIQYSNQHQYVLKCILERGLNIFDDIKSYFSSENKFLILIDDANRIHTALTYIKEYFPQKLEDGSIKLVLTVRDYAKNKVFENLKKLAYQEIEIKEFTREEIITLIKRKYQLENHLFLDRIVELSDGNPRLALMITKIAKEKNSLKSINDISNVYDDYFSNIFKDSKINDETLKVVAIIAFFRVVDNNNDEQMKMIDTVFNISKNDFWKQVLILHEQELCDLYEDEVVKISDQIILSYLFYYTVFKKKILSIDNFIENFFFQYQSRTVDVIFPLIHSFDAEMIKETMKKPINTLWKDNHTNLSNKLILMETFWFIKPTDTLVYCEEYINAISKEDIDIKTIEIVYEKNLSYSDSNKLLNILKKFRNHYDLFPLAIELILQYFEKEPLKLHKEILYICINDFGYSIDSYRYDYIFEKTLLDKLWKKTDTGNNQLFTKLYIEVIKYYLHIELDTSKALYRDNITYINYSLYQTEKLITLRKEIWDNLFKLEKHIIKDVLFFYIDNIQYLRFNDYEIVKSDSILILDFLDNFLSSKEYIDCKMIQKYLKQLQKYKITFDENLLTKFTNEAYHISKVLLEDKYYYRKKYTDLSWQEVEILQKKELHKFIQRYQTSSQIINFLNHTQEIYIHTSNSHDLNKSIKYIFIDLSENNFTLFLELFKFYLIHDNTFELYHNHIAMKNLIKKLGKYETYKLLSEEKNQNKIALLFNFYCNLSKESIQEEDIKKLLQLYKLSNDYIPSNLHFLKNYMFYDEKILVKVVKVLYEKSQIKKSFLHELYFLFYSFNEDNQLIDIFKDDMSLLKKVYCLIDYYQQHHDYDCKALNQILNVDTDFIREYVDFYLSKEKKLNQHEVNKDMTVLWERDDYEVIIMNIINTYFKYKNKDYFFGENLKILFGNLHKEKIEISYKEKRIISKYIEENSQNMEKINFIFELISHFTDAIKKEFISLFIQYNNDYTNIHQIIKEPSYYSFGGSAVVYWNSRKEFYESLLELFQSIKFLKHRQYVENVIENYRIRIVDEKKQEFIDD